MLVTLAVDGGGELLRDEGEDVFVALAEVSVFGIAFEDERAQGAMVDLERYAQPVEREGSVEFDFSALLHLLGLLGSAEQGLAGAQYVLDEASPEFCRCGSRILLV